MSFYRKKRFYRKAGRAAYKVGKWYHREQLQLGAARRAIGTANRALKVAQGVKGLLNVEFKHFDTSVDANVVAAGSIFTFNSIPQGTDDSERNGDTVKMQSIDMKYRIKGDVDVDHEFMRIMIVCDKLVSNDMTIGGGTDDSLLDTADIISFRDLDNTKRFSVLYDKVHKFSHNSTEVSYVRIHKKFPMKIKWDGVNGNTQRENKLHFVYMSTATENWPIINMKCRIRYVDN